MLLLFLLAFLGLACIWLIADGIRRRAGVIEFPFLVGCSVLGFLFPQAIGTVRNADAVPEAGLIKSLIMCVLCLAAVYWGWHAPVPAKWLRARKRSYSAARVYWFGMALLAVGVIAFLRLASLTGGIVDFFSVHGNYTLDWRGRPVAYAFFMQFLTPGLALAFLSALRLGSFWRLALPCPALAIQLAFVLFLGRRGVLIDLCVLALGTAFFATGWLPRAAPLLVALPLFALSIFLAPYYRTYSLVGADRERLREIPVNQTVQDTLAGQHAEFWTMTYIVHVTDLTRSYELGRGLYNSFVQFFVPKLIVGESVKDSLYWGEPQTEYYDNPLGWVVPYGMVPSGPGSAYRQFWFLGALWFYLIARGMRYVFVSAVASRDLFAQTAYIVLLLPSISAVVNDMFAVYGVFVFGPALLAIRKSSQIGPVAHLPPTLPPFRKVTAPASSVLR